MPLRLVHGNLPPSEDGWLVAKTRCCTCLRNQVSVYPVGANDHTLECAFCGAQQSAVIARYGPDQVEFETGQSELN